MKSMTGYGRATARTERYEITAEVHSVNHRYLETSVRLPAVWQKKSPWMKNWCGCIAILLSSGDSWKAQSQQAERWISWYRK